MRAIGKRSTEGVNAESIGLLAFRGDGGPDASARRSSGRCGPARAPPSGTSASSTTSPRNGEVWTLDIKGEEWGEVDFPEDVAGAEALAKRWDERREAKAA